MKTLVKTTKLIVALAAAPMIAMANSANAESVLIDFSTAEPAPVGADSNGNHWNSIGNSGNFGNPANFVSSAPLIDTIGDSTPWAVSISGVSNRSGFGGTGINGPSGPAPFDQSFATTDGIFTNAQDKNGNSIVNITFTGLVANSGYDLSFIGGRATNGSNGDIKVITGTGPDGVLLNDGTVLNLSVVSDGTGTIGLTLDEFDPPTDFSPDNITLNAMSITGAVPEPGSLALLALGGCFLARRRRG